MNVTWLGHRDDLQEPTIGRSAMHHTSALTFDRLERENSSRREDREKDFVDVVLVDLPIGTFDLDVMDVLLIPFGRDDSHKATLAP